MSICFTKLTCFERGMLFDERSSMFTFRGQVNIDDLLPTNEINILYGKSCKIGSQYDNFNDCVCFFKGYSSDK